jgi:lactate dehydrogenase-like 2-hydroxyacid dehydrogenase
MASMKDPVVRAVADLVSEFSAPEVVEALLTLAKHQKDAQKRSRNSEWQGWATIETAMSEALKKIE